MNTTHRTRWLLALAVGAAAPVVVASPALGQVRATNQDGAALDANNRVGSGGRNAGATGIDNRANAQRVTGNQIVTGNVTGGRHFRDSVGYTDPREFRDTTFSDSSRAFIRDSTSIGEVRSPNAMSNQAQPFYDPAITVTPPAGYVQGGPGVQNYVPAPTPSANTLNNAAGFPTTLQPLSPIPQPGELVMPGPTDESGGSVLTASPLYGVRQWRTGEAGDQQFLSELEMGLSGRRDVRLDQDQVQRLRAEFSPTTEENDRTSITGALVARPLSSAVEQRELSSAVGAQGGADTGQRTRTRILANPQEQNPQYVEMRRRLEQYNNDRNATDQEAHQAFVQAQRMRDRAAAESTGQAQQPGGIGTGQPGAGQAAPGAAPGAPTAPKPAPEGAEQQNLTNAERLGLTDYGKRAQQRARGEDPDATGEKGSAPDTRGEPTRRIARPEPVKVPTLAQSAQNSGFSQLLRKAEELMKEGKFTSALDEYDKAQQVAPDSALVTLGRAHAELGATYYSRAESHLREAFNADPALLMGQYDLQAFYGEDRLRTLVNDLKEIARLEESQPRPVFLLAYIAYNTGNERMAGGYLDLAEKRAGKDPLYNLIREHWNLPEEGGSNGVETSAPEATDLNK
jgi:tetratricopeptide (TPR) repeat protein